MMSQEFESVWNVLYRLQPNWFPNDNMRAKIIRIVDGEIVDPNYREGFNLGLDPSSGGYSGYVIMNIKMEERFFRKVYVPSHVRFCVYAPPGVAIIERDYPPDTDEYKFLSDFVEKLTQYFIDEEWKRRVESRERDELVRKKFFKS